MRTTGSVCVWILFAFFLWQVPPVLAEDGGPGPGKWDAGIWGSGGKVANDHGRDTRTLLVGIGLGRIVAGRPGGMLLKYAVELAPLVVVLQRTNAYGVEVVPFLMKWYFASGPQARPYLGFGGGMLFSNKEIPDRTKTFNFTPQMRFGVEFPVRRSQAFSIDFQYIHISNANTAKRNPGYNSLNARFGYQWSW